MLCILLPFLLCVGSSDSERWKRAIKANLSVASLVCVSKAGLPKRKSPSWKISKSLAFGLLRSLWRKWCWGPRCLLLVTWILWVFGFPSWWRRKGTWGEGDLQGVTRERKQVVGWSGCLAGWVRVALSLPFSLGKQLAFPKSYSGWKPQCTLNQLA